ncbi:hypothetical protein HMN09_00380600 [Mycena chlorophos]|uniref:Cytochrome P450 n=1 Tax=Mycena chlorophos TaxID=658473 RepID=A0A8H6WHD0_MYCCL|nr:hypothetical protein HMN09_00380600 [Mycena chlorophos]
MDPTLFAVVFLVLLALYVRRAARRDDVARLRGPKSPSFTFGNLLQLQDADPYGKHEFTWLEEFGSVYKIKACFGKTRLVISDPEAMRFVLNSPDVGWASTQKKVAKILFGLDSAFLARGDRHSYLRRVMNPWFSPRSIREMSPMMKDGAQKARSQTFLVNHWDSNGFVGQMVDVVPTLHSAALDILGEALLETEIGGLEGKGELSKIQNQLIDIFSDAGKVGKLAEAFVPSIPDLLLNLVLMLPLPGLDVLQKYMRLTTEMSESLLARKMLAGEDRDASFVGRLASATDIRNEGIPDHIRTVLMAGDRTTGDTLSWTVYQIAAMPEFQRALRKEVHDAHVSQAAAELNTDIDYDKLPLLNALINEVLRFYPALPLPERITLADCVIPLSAPVLSNMGEMISELRVRAGQEVYLAIGSYHRMKSIWGDDADEFRPERWLREEDDNDEKSRKLKVPGVGGPRGSLLSFLSGPGVCIGYRFALLLLQVLVSTLIRNFTFALPDGGDNVRPRCMITTVPWIEDEDGKGGRQGVEVVVGRVEDGV